VAARLSREIPNSFYPNQYDNLSNRETHYLATGPEIWEQTDGKITHFVAGMGTCGTISGVSKYLKEKNPKIVSVGVDTYGSVFKKLKETGEFDRNEIYPYLTEGIGEDIIPKNLELDLVDHIIKVADKDAALMARKLARMEGLFCGWSSGSAMYGSLEFARNLGKEAFVVVVLPDHGTRYLGKVYNDTWMSDNQFIEAGNMLTAGEILGRKEEKIDVITLHPHHTLSDAIAIIREKFISQIPIVENGKVIGSVTESRVLNTILDDPGLKGASVTIAMSDPFPFVLPSTRIDVISKMINKDNPAVLVQMEDGKLGMLTKFDLISVLSA